MIGQNYSILSTVKNLYYPRSAPTEVTPRENGSVHEDGIWKYRNLRL